jgi:cyclopropane fatty-acyl-phospholipid synthase-like methyltransferase
MPMNMNSFEGKRILALVRDGDYAHAGEEEAIERVFRAIPKHAGSSLLDVGCGCGGSSGVSAAARMGPRRRVAS